MIKIKLKGAKGGGMREIKLAYVVLIFSFASCGETIKPARHQVQQTDTGVAVICLSVAAEIQQVRKTIDDLVAQQGRLNTDNGALDEDFVRSFELSQQIEQQQDLLSRLVAVAQESGTKQRQFRMGRLAQKNLDLEIQIVNEEDYADLPLPTPLKIAAAKLAKPPTMVNVERMHRILINKLKRVLERNRAEIAACGSL